MSLRGLLLRLAAESGSPCWARTTAFLILLSADVIRNVMASATNVIRAGFIQSPARPGNNVTGADG